jgi:hypothetical protein
MSSLAATPADRARSNLRTRASDGSRSKGLGGIPRPRAGWEDIAAPAESDPQRIGPSGTSRGADVIRRGPISIKSTRPLANFVIDSCVRRSDDTDAPPGLPLALSLLNDCHPRTVNAYDDSELAPPSRVSDHPSGSGPHAGFVHVPGTIPADDGVIGRAHAEPAKALTARGHAVRPPPGRMRVSDRNFFIPRTTASDMARGTVSKGTWQSRSEDGSPGSPRPRPHASEDDVES